MKTSDKKLDLVVGELGVELVSSAGEVFSFK